jgi:hypothetical protein
MGAVHAFLLEKTGVGVGVGPEISTRAKNRVSPLARGFFQKNRSVEKPGYRTKGSLVCWRKSRRVVGVNVCFRTIAGKVEFCPGRFVCF